MDWNTFWRGHFSRDHLCFPGSLQRWLFTRSTNQNTHLGCVTLYVFGWTYGKPALQCSEKKTVLALWIIFTFMEWKQREWEYSFKNYFNPLCMRQRKNQLWWKCLMCQKFQKQVWKGFYSQIKRWANDKRKNQMPRLDDCVGNESLETLFWLKWGFVVLITGYVYSQKC